MRARAAAWLSRHAYQRRLNRFTPPPRPPLAALTDIVYDATLMSLASVRLAIKNLVIIRTLRDGRDYDDTFYLAAVQQALLVEATDRARDGQRVMESLASIRTRSGQPEHPTDYRAIDLDTMRRRAAVSNALATRLREVAAESCAVAEILQSARAAALDEIADNIERSTRLLAHSPVTPQERSVELASLASDLQRSLARTTNPTTR